MHSWIRPRCVKSKRYANASINDFLDNVDDLTKAIKDVETPGYRPGPGQGQNGAGAAKSALSDSAAQVRGQASQVTRTTDSYVRDNPWQVVGIAAVVGVVLGAMMSRRSATEQMILKGSAEAGVWDETPPHAFLVCAQARRHSVIAAGLVLEHDARGAQPLAYTVGLAEVLGARAARRSAISSSICASVSVAAAPLAAALSHPPRGSRSPPCCRASDRRPGPAAGGRALCPWRAASAPPRRLRAASPAALALFNSRATPCITASASGVLKSSSMAA